jgi:hypothetical protein
MNWFVSEPVSTESMLRTGLPFLEAFGALLAIIAIFTLVVAVLHTILAARFPDAHLKSSQFGVAKGRIERFPPAPAKRMKLLLQAWHVRGWLFTR